MRQVREHPATRIDAHHHLWRYTPEEFDWLTPDMAELRRDFLLAELASTLATSGITGTIAVQARTTIAETDFLLACAKTSPRILGVVGWVPLVAPDIDRILQRLSADPNLSGLRDIAQGQPAGYLLRPDFHRGIDHLTSLDLAFDILIYADQLREAIHFVDHHPHQRFVLDHAAKPPIRDNQLEPWRTLLFDLAQRPNVFCKLSGLTTEARWKDWTLATLRPYLDTCVEAFTPSRLLAGSDWPVCLLASGYSHWWSTLDQYFEPFTDDERNAIFAGNAQTAYRLPPTDPTPPEVTA